jgi:hypothetical protein
MAFRFTDDEWTKIAGMLERVGRLRYDGDRRDLEFFCECFAQTRPRLGRNMPTPARARDAWFDVAAAAKRLQAAIAGLKPAGAADFTAASWAAELPLVAQASKRAADLEMHGVRREANNSDPFRDAFLRQLMRAWSGYGGRLSHARNGPCVRFLMAVSSTALEAAGEHSMTADELVAAVRRLRVASSAPKDFSARH